MPNKNGASRYRLDFSKIPTALQIPNLIEVQKRSYDRFLPGEVLCSKCGTYNANTPDFCNKCGDPVGLQLKYDVAECEERGMTYSAPLKVTIRLTIYDKDPETGNKSIRDIKEQEVFF